MVAGVAVFGLLSGLVPEMMNSALFCVVVALLGRCFL